MATSIDQQFVEFIVKSLVGDPKAVKVERSIDEKGVLLELTVAPDDLGRVIGKRGNTAQSIRTLLRALGTKNDARYNLKIVDVNGEGGHPRAPREEKREDDKAVAHDEQDSVDTATQDTTSSADDDSGTGASQWAHLASKPEDNDEADEGSTDEEDESSTSSSSVVEKTRKELEDLSSLDI